MSAPLNKLRTIFKAGSFLAGLVLLLAGAIWLGYPDWDIGISVLMATTTLLTAEWATKMVWTGQWRWMPLALFWAWLSVDGVYWAYWSYMRPEVMIREGQWQASLCLYALCGVIWFRLVPIAAEFWTTRQHREGI